VRRLRAAPGPGALHPDRRRLPPQRRRPRPRGLHAGRGLRGRARRHVPGAAACGECTRGCMWAVAARPHAEPGMPQPGVTHVESENSASDVAVLHARMPAAVAMHWRSCASSGRHTTPTREWKATRPASAAAAAMCGRDAKANLHFGRRAQQARAPLNWVCLQLNWFSYPITSPSPLRCSSLAAATDQLQQAIWVVDMQPVPSVGQCVDFERALARTRGSFLLDLPELVLERLCPPAVTA
jgi:hypothetical protein